MTRRPTDSDLLDEALEYLESHCDEGPPGEGWQSDRLQALCNAIRLRLGMPPTSVVRGR
jgi:hypothetical protein